MILLAGVLTQILSTTYSIASEVGCATFSIADAMHDDPEAYVDPGNSHFTATGHRLWATAFADALLYF